VPRHPKGVKKNKAQGNLCHSRAAEFSSGYYFLFLEQYHLFNKRFNLNTQRIVNFRVSQGRNIYLYDIEGKILFYASKSLNLGEV